MRDDIQKQMSALNELGNKLTEKKAEQNRHFLLVSSALFGILISLQSTPHNNFCIRLTFFLAVFLLACCILTGAIASFLDTDSMIRARKADICECKKALHENRELKPVFVPTNKILVVCEKVAYICFALAVLLLSAYSFLVAFYV